MAIVAGQLVVCSEELRWPGDLLHEAGHIAVTPEGLRSALDGTLADDSAIPHAGEAEATAWAYAAVVAIGLDPTVLFHDGGYHGQSASLAFTFTMGGYPGAGGLIATGMALSLTTAAARGLKPYPHMIRWLRE